MPGPVQQSADQPTGMSRFQQIGANTQVFQQPACVAVANTTGEGFPNGTPVIDGYQTQIGDVVLLTAQDDATANGLWWISAEPVDSYPWYRATGMSSTTTVYGMIVEVMNGSTYANSVWVLTSPTTGTIVDTSDQTWTEATGGGGGGLPSWFQSGSGSPIGAVTPNTVGGPYFDTSGSTGLWVSTGTTNEDWAALGGIG